MRARDARGDRVTAAAEKTVPGAPMPGATVAEALAVVVVGGGVGGMAAAYELTREATRCGISLQVTVLEARERVGGSILTETVDGCIVEGGPDCFVSEKPWGIELIEEVGLGEHLSGTNDARRRTYVLWKGRPHPLPDGLILLVPTRILPFVTTRLFSWPGKLRMALDLVLPRKRDGADETLGDFIRRRLGRETLDKLGEPLVAGIHSGDPETMSIKATFPRFVDMEREDRSLIVATLKRMRAVRKARVAAGAAAGAATGAAPAGGLSGAPATPAAANARPRLPRTMFMTLDSGLGTLMTELTDRVGADALHTHQTVQTLSRRPSGGWTAQTAEGDTYEADGVLFATPAYATAEMVRGVAPELADDLAAIPYVSSATVTLAYPAASFADRLDGFGLVIPKGEQRQVKAFTWVTSKFYGRAPADIVLMRCFIRATAGETDGLSEEQMAAMARAELADILGIAVPPLWARAYRWDRAMPQYVVGHLERMARIDACVDALPGVRLAGGAYRGSGIPDTVRFSREQARALVGEFTSR